MLRPFSSVAHGCECERAVSANGLYDGNEAAMQIGPPRGPAPLYQASRHDPDCAGCQAARQAAFLAASPPLVRSDMSLRSFSAKAA